MQHVTQLEDVQAMEPALMTIGVFDGVHRGHQALIRELVAAARSSSQTAVVLTFHPHPDAVIDDTEARYYLTSPDERAALLAEMGVDLVITHPFDERIQQMHADEFVDRLLQYVHLRTLWVGKDFAMGRDRAGDVPYLKQQGAEKGFAVKPIDLLALQDSGLVISSTEIRQLLDEGQVEKAARLLGRPYSVSGTVVKGDQRGRTIGFPTANMAVWKGKRLPSNGVYAGRVTVGEKTFMAVTNVGVRPTFDGQAVTVEPHLLDFDRDIYGETIRLTFEHRLRGEQKFDGIAALKAQLERDRDQARALLSAQADEG